MNPTKNIAAVKYKHMYAKKNSTKYDIYLWLEFSWEHSLLNQTLNVIIPFIIIKCYMYQANKPLISKLLSETTPSSLQCELKVNFVDLQLLLIGQMNFTFQHV